MFSNASSGCNSTLPTNFQLQDLSHDHRTLPYNDEENDAFLSGHQNKDARDQAVKSNQNLKTASFWIPVNIVATILIVI
jgi:hypothetical protein